MVLSHIYNTGLPKEKLKKIENREYTQEQIEYIYKFLYDHYQLKRKAWLKVMIMMIVIVLVIGLLGLINVQERMLKVYGASVLVTGILCFVICLYAKINVVEKEIRQFYKVLKIGYPEIAEKIER